MRKNLHYKVLASVLAISSLNYALPANAEEYTITIDGNYTITRDYKRIYDYDSYNPSFSDGNTLLIVNNTSTTDNLYGQIITGTIVKDADNNTVYITNGSYIDGNIMGGYTWGIDEAADNTAHNNIVIIENSTVESSHKITGGFSLGYYSTPPNNTVILAGNSILKGVDLYGFEGNSNRFTNDKLILVNWSGEVGSINNFTNIDFENIDITKGSTLTVTGTTNFSGNININSITVNEATLAGDYAQGEVILSNISWSPALGNKVTVNNVDSDDNEAVQTTLDSIPLDDYYTDDNTDNGIFVNKFNALGYEIDKDNYQVNFTADVDKSILTGKFIDEDGTHYNSKQTAETAALTIGKDFKTNVGTVAGVYAAKKSDGTAQDAIGGTVNISGSTDWNGTVYAGYSEKGEVNNNTITVASGTKAENLILSGSNKEVSSASGNTLNIAGNGSKFNGIENFDTINFDDVSLKSDAALTVTSADVSGTAINLESLSGGQAFNEGDTLTLIVGNVTGTPESINNKVTAGLTQDLVVEETVNTNGIQLAVKDVSMNDQITLVAENRAVAAAFVNQGTDLIEGSLDTISRDSNYGVKTFAAVHGNRSKYDVNSDIKINGWSTIVGVGNAAEFADGDEFSWGLFYENGSGNYRTYNEFNNEFFRGDGILVYNGGGIAARYENANGVYTEGSLRAGMLKSEMDNALRDGSGNYYGYDSESAYYGAHIGVGKIISLSESSDLDVYGKFFHTYTEGDSFTVAKDKFEFDSITSDRLRIGARVTTNKANAFSTYYGLAYEYEFNGDADMTAQGLKAPTQSLQGSSVMAEIGFNYQPTPTSQWSFDLNMRGYTGERQGGSFNVQATYTF